MTVHPRRPGWLACALAIACVAGCGRGVHRDWDAEWASLETPGRHAPEGTTYAMVTWSSRPEGVRAMRESWRLLHADSTDGTFAALRDGGAESEVTLELHPRVPDLHYGTSVARHTHSRYAYMGGLETVHVPAGTFHCGRTWKDSEEPDGVVMRVDEWWAPNVPVPVQRWVRWEQQANDTLRNPPRKPDDMVVGTTWSVLERVEKPR